MEFYVVSQPAYNVSNMQSYCDGMYNYLYANGFFNQSFVPFGWAVGISILCIFCGVYIGYYIFKNRKV